MDIDLSNHIEHTIEQENLRRSYYALRQPALTGDTVTQGDADYCADYGHRYYRRDGIDQGYCPRCGVTTTPTPTDVEDLPVVYGLPD